MSVSAAGAQTETILYDFRGGNNGESPVGGLLPDGHGDYFGVTLETQTTFGTVFELSPRSGGWTLATIYTFQGGNDGSNPNATLVMDAAGNLYGETAFGGNGKSVYCNGGCGTVFELSPNSNGGWTKTTLYNFQGNPPGSSFFDASYPAGGLVLDKAGNLYGTTLNGGESCSFTNAGCGVVFELSPNSSGGWTETLLHKFSGAGGAYPEGGVIFDSAGNLYGTTFEGGPSNLSCYYGCGTVFKLTPKSGGGWTASVLHTFNGSNGSFPSAGLVMDGKGNLYATTPEGGAFGVGVVFELEPQGSTWKRVPVFQFRLTSGYSPFAPLTVDSSGNLYGTTEAGPVGGAFCPAQGGCGVVFKLTQSAGKWQESIVHAFTGQPDGVGPLGSVTINSQGNIFGVTGQGGTANLGAIYEITP
ncbi:MAG TPA: choice-of-anchor tandem repeat GloVer-containing protein [Candidatus Dormibacteraeota bacterium]|nr:choice-of-anchor tandem repeat GloVer-containing protein [Candidatus Dormibacteraeota bacterium]